MVCGCGKESPVIIEVANQVMPLTFRLKRKTHKALNNS